MIMVCHAQYTKFSIKKFFFDVFLPPNLPLFSLLTIFSVSSRSELSKSAICMKYLYVVLGTISLVLGIIGIFMPVLPTTPFLLLTAALYFRSSDRLYAWLMGHRYLGPYIKNFRENKAIPLNVKIVSVGMVWITLLYCTLFVADVWWMRLMFISIAVGVSVHILHYRTLRNKGNKGDN